MDANGLLKDNKEKMRKSLDYTLREFSSVHTGKATPAMVESLNVSIESYGSSVKLKEVAAITTPDARTISIQPWDKSVANDIRKAIEVANIGLNPVVDGSIIRCPIPELSRERREQLVKSVKSMGEDGKVRIRDVRRNTIDGLKKLQKGGTISEDDLKRYEKEVQHDTDKFIADISKHVEDKEKELLKI